MMRAHAHRRAAATRCSTARGSSPALSRGHARQLLAGVAAGLVLAGSACGDDGSAPAWDAAPGPGDAAPIHDAAPPGDGAQSLTWVSFAITGCAPAPPIEAADAGPLDGDPDPGTAPCRGAAPLTLQLTAVTPAPVNVYVWDFGLGGDADPGDAGPAAGGPTPTQVYELPGVYDVSLSVAGPGGSAMITRREAVVVEPAGLGARCSRDAQCGDARACVCDAETPCPAALPGGLCSVACDPDTPCAEGVCADLAAAGPEEPADWERSLCLPSCGPDVACPAGLTCQALPAGDRSGWIQGCFAPGVLGPVGSSCKGASGELQHWACAGGLCLDMGARGACSAPCANAACPDTAACADLDDPAQRACLLRCADADVDCQRDPWLACEPPGAPGGFTVDELASPAGYCAPRSCEQPDACGPDGTCTPEGYCAPG